MDKVVEELQEIKAILNTNQAKNPNELLTAKQISEEFNIGINTVRDKQFKDPKLPVQTYTHPMKVTRGAYQSYFNERHDYLSEKNWKVGENKWKITKKSTRD